MTTSSHTTAGGSRSADGDAHRPRGRADGRPRLSAPERRVQLLDVAGALFAAHGYHGLSMEQLAEAAGVSKPVLYQHFPSKRELYIAVVSEAATEMEQRVRKALEGTEDNRGRVHGAIGAYFDFIHDRRFQLLSATSELADDEIRGLIERAESRVARAVGALIAADAGLSDTAAHFLAYAVRGLAVEGARWWLEHPEVGRDEAVGLVGRLAWRGLGSFTPETASGRDDTAESVRPGSRSPLGGDGA
jgi:AcrR family transcriptional regulator